jgi:hypothetical protein
MTELETARSGHVVIGVDTHKHIHLAAEWTRSARSSRP